MKNRKIEVDANQAKGLLDIIDQQNIKAANLARMPIWLNLVTSVLVTWLVFYDFISYTFDGQNIYHDLLICIILIEAIFWYKYLKDKGLKQKLFPLNRGTLLAFLFGLFGAAFGSDLLVFVSETTQPMFACLLLLLLLLSLCFFVNRFPLSEYVPRNAK